MTKLNGQQYGLGVEMEGFIVNSSRGQERIEGISSAEWIIQEIRKKVPSLSHNLSLEEASVMLELKSDVFCDVNLAISQILEIRYQVDQLLSMHGCRLIFEPVLEHPFDFIPATSNTNSRTHQLIESWSKTSEGLKLLYATAIASFQINDSRPFKNQNSELEKLEISRKLHNHYSYNFNQLNSRNLRKVDFSGQTRMDKLIHLLSSVKKDQFNKSGYQNVMDALIPPYFADLESMKKWMTAHSRDAQNFEQSDSKNEHAITMKVKRGQYWAVESRVYDALDDLGRIKEIAKFNQKFIDKVLNF